MTIEEFNRGDMIYDTWSRGYYTITDVYYDTDNSGNKHLIYIGAHVSTRTFDVNEVRSNPDRYVVTRISVENKK